ncbi:MAG TPA: hypothetical protein VGG89_17790 [Candidatus Baltobacteraceae bacterium]
MSKNLDSVIVNAYVRAKRLADGAAYSFTALFSRTRTITETGDNINGEIWRIFKVAVDEPAPYDITFCNDGARAAIKTATEALRAAWLQRMVQQIPPPYDDYTPGNTARLAQANQVMFKDALNAEFLNTATAQLLNHFYWLAGRYDIALELVADGDKQTHSKKWKMTVTREMEQQLRQNARRLVAAACNQPTVVVGQFFTAWPTYEPPE